MAPEAAANRLQGCNSSSFLIKKTMRIFTTLLLFVSGLLICPGCNRTKAPEELKTLYPVTITVMDGSQPVPGVDVRLSSKGPQGAYACSAMTNTGGVAKIQSTRSTYTGNGAPPGTYSVVLLKSVKLPPELEPQDEDQDNPVAASANRAKRAAYLKQNQAIPQVLAHSNSPVELTVADQSGATAEIDISQYRQ